jgi:hypothetical protein
MARHIKNIAPTDLSTAYSREQSRLGGFKFGDLYTDTSVTAGDATYIWGVYSKGTGGLTCGKNVVCVPVPSATNPALFTADFSDCDAELKQDAVFPCAAVTHGNRCWFKCKGTHIIQQRTAVTTVAQYDPFAPTDDKTMDVTTTPYNATGIFLDNPGGTAGSYVDVILWGRRYS